MSVGLPENTYDVIVIGSGMGGMTAATALTRFNHKVLLLEQAPNIGGLTHSFSRKGFSWDVGLHYCGTFCRDQIAGRILDWLSGGTVKFQSVGTVYDTLHFPDDLVISVGRPAEAYKMELKDHFPDNELEIDAYFEALQSAEEACQAVGADKAMPEPFRTAHHWWNIRKVQRWCGRTTDEVISELISNPKLAAILSAQWGTYGGKPEEASFAFHGLIMGHYLEGAAYPIGGASSIAKGLIPVIESVGGKVQANTTVNEILIEDSKAVGVRTQSREIFKAPTIVSAIGAGETVKHLLPQTIQHQDWAREIASFKPSVCHFDLFLGFEGDIVQHGATRANHWFYENWNTSDAIWKVNGNDPIQMIFVSFGSLKNPDHNPGPQKKYSGDMLVLADWSSVERFANGGADQHPEEWKAFKQDVEARMLEAFKQKFPDLAPLIVYHELGTPLATESFTGHAQGGFYGIETTPRRMLSKALNIRTPVSGLLLSGQDVMSPGIAGALAAGMLTAGAIDPRVLTKLT